MIESLEKVLSGVVLVTGKVKAIFKATLSVGKVESKPLILRTLKTTLRLHPLLGSSLNGCSISAFELSESKDD